MASDSQLFVSFSAFHKLFSNMVLLFNCTITNFFDKITFVDRNYKKWVFMALVLIVLAAAGTFILFNNLQTPAQIYSTKPYSPAITINGHRFSVEIANTPEKESRAFPTNNQCLPMRACFLFLIFPTGTSSG